MVVRSSMGAVLSRANKVLRDAGAASHGKETTLSTRCIWAAGDHLRAFRIETSVDWLSSERQLRLRGREALGDWEA